MRAFACRAVGKLCATHGAVVRAFACRVLGKLFLTKITVVVLVLILMLARRRGVFFLKFCATVVAEVVAVSVYVLLAGLIDKIT